MRISALHNFAIELKNQAKYPVGSGVLRTEVDCVVTNLSHDRHSHNFRHAQCAAYSHAAQC